jgi:sugar phosphate isomerase/epimerase
MKDGFYPVSGRSLGEEVPLGEGKVNVREFIKKSEGIGYKGCYCIEREISGERQNLDIIAARDLIAETLRGC